ncbi:MAG: hypothetical protein ACYTGP_04205, partial [Planctomycetota bacterium]
EWIDHDNNENTLPILQPGAFPLPEWGQARENRDVRFLGMERQPFLLEAFVGHVYKAWDVPAAWFDPTTNPPSRVLFKTDENNTELHSSVFAVQIANPYDQPIDFFHNAYKYELEAFGETIDIRRAIEQALHVSELTLAPARSDRPSTMILYAIGSAPPDSPNFRNRIIDFLDIESDDHPGGTYIINIGPQASDLTDRATFDDNSNIEDGIRLIRTELLYQSGGPGVGGGAAGERVVIDRFTDPDIDDPFEGALDGIASDLNKPSTYPAELPTAQPPAPVAWPGYPGWEPADQAQTHWMQWVRVTRSWGNEFDDGDGVNGPFVNPAERNPRYVFSTSMVSTARDKTSDTRANYESQRVFPDPSGLNDWPGVSFSLDTLPDDGEAGLPWITTDYPILRACTLPDGTCRDLPVYECENLTPAEGGPGVPSPNIGERCDALFTPTYTFGTRKPTFFDMNKENDPAWSAGNPAWGFPDKGYYHSFYPLQMLQKDRDFEQVGELANVWLFGHELEFSSGNYDDTKKTFSEHMAEGLRAENGEFNRFINRLQLGEMIGRGKIGNHVQPPDPRLGVPQMPAGLRIFDAFVCDGPGANYFAFDINGNPIPIEEYLFGNANGFTGRMTPGLININTAPPEVLRTLPHWYKLVHMDLDWDNAMLERLPRTHVAESVISSRRDNLANVAEMRGDRGFESTGEMLLIGDLAAQATAPIDYSALGSDYYIDPNAWRLDFAGVEPFEILDASANDRRFGAMLSTDRDLPNGACCLGGGCLNITRVECASLNGSFKGPYTWCDLPDLNVCGLQNANVQFDEDGVSGDAEEANLLFAGASNLITTRSDVFTVYFRVRSFRQNADNGKWDATDLNHIVGDVRYVMLVDRSEVNRPGDQPKILFLDKLPN